MTGRRAAPTRECRPGQGGVLKDRAGELCPSLLPGDVDPSSGEYLIDLATAPARDRIIWLSGWEHGYIEGRGAEVADYAQMMEDLAARYVRMVHLNEEIERGLAATIRRGPYADAAERRGQPERAARQRQTLRERGIWPAAS